MVVRSAMQLLLQRAGNLPASYVVHTVGPVWNEGNNKEIEKLRSCYQNSLALASEYKAKSITFQNISTGIYLIPKQLAAETALESVTAYLDSLASQ
ncbi:macro domain-containing protein [Paenibacillus sp. R14(2021)]|uniref:macro domain-containing protein n=1 Tax=Paenibacillus sp. R14(2021) TaxID=2859228 RepID=UPI002157B3CB|nr:macro domain-containing protein [Paenibacillus sp. R14(2021)]